MDAGGGPGKHPARYNIPPPRVLREMQRFELLDRLRRAARSNRRVAFQGEVAIVLNQISVRVCDALMVCLRGEAEVFTIQRHVETTKMIGLLTELCSRPDALRIWNYNDEQSEWLLERVRQLVGANRIGRIRTCIGGEATPLGAGRVVDSPILMPLMCALLSPELLLVPLARMLAEARRGK